MNETRPFKWVLGNFATGELIPSVPMDEIGGGEIDISVDNNDGADIEISLANAPQEVKNSWTSFYKEVLHFAACQNSETGDIIWAGMVNKISPNLKSRSLSFQLVNPKEYMAARIVGENFGATIEDPNAGITFTGASYADIIGQIVTRCFSPIVGSSTAQPPNILGNVTPVPAQGEVSFKVLFSDAMSYQEAMESAIEESGEDIETRFTARMDGSSRVVWDFRVGTMSAPHLNDSSSLELDIALIDDDDLFRISEFQADIDSTELFNSFYISSKAGDSETSKGMDLKNATLPSSDFPILLEKYYNPGVELSEAQLNAQMSSWISKGMDTKRTGSISLELEDDRFKTWASSYLGRMVHFVGYDDTLSAGNTSTLRIVGVRLDTATSRAILDLMSKANRYPRLPRKNATGSKKNDKNSQSPSNRVIRQKDIKNIKPGGGTTVPPWEGGGSYPPSDAGPGGQWGSGGDTTKDDLSPYEITNFSTIWSSDEQMDISRWYFQNKTNLCFSTRMTSDLGAGGNGVSWGMDAIPGLQTVSNSNTPDFNLIHAIGSGYVSEGSMKDWNEDRLQINSNDLVNDLASNHESWGVQFDPYWYHNIRTVSVSVNMAFIVNNLAYFVLNASFETNAKDDYTQGRQRRSVTIFCYREILDYRNFGPLQYLKDLTIHDNMSTPTTSVSVVGSYAVIQTVFNGFFVQDFSDPLSLSPLKWYSIPNPPSIGGRSVAVTQKRGVIGKVKVDGNFKTFMIKMGSDNRYGMENLHKVYGIELMENGVPLAKDGASWVDISQYFPVPSNLAERYSYLVDSWSGYLVYRITGEYYNDLNEIVNVEDAFMQGDDGVWHKLAGTFNADWSTSLINQSYFQWKDWIYTAYFRKNTQDAQAVEYYRSFSLRKIATWALDEPTSP